MYRIVYLACSIITCWCILIQREVSLNVFDNKGNGFCLLVLLYLKTELPKDELI